jgi:hypothetical protein
MPKKSLTTDVRTDSVHSINTYQLKGVYIDARCIDPE